MNNLKKAAVSERQEVMLNFSEQPCIFIIGSPRSGTTWLQIMLGAHAQVATTVELNLFEQYLIPWINSWKQSVARRDATGMHQGLPCVWQEEEFHNYLREFLSRIYLPLMENKPGATQLLHKSCDNSFYTSEILHLLPKTKFIHLIRDGRDVAVSMMAAKQTIGEWGGTAERAATLWKDHVIAARKTQQYGNRFIEVRYEDLIANGPGTLEKIFNFCELPATRETAEKIYTDHEFSKMKRKRQESDHRYKRPADHYRKGITGSWEGELNPADKYTIHKIAGDLLDELGYTSGNWWASSQLQRLTLPWRYGFQKRWAQLTAGIKSTGKIMLGN